MTSDDVVKSVFAGICAVLCVLSVSGESVNGVALRRVVDASAYGFSPQASPSENAQALQRALDGGNCRVTITNAACYKLGGTVYLDDNTELVCEKGTLLKKAGQYAHMILNRGIASGVTNVNITVRGLSISDGGINVPPDPGSDLHGLWGLITFHRVRNVLLDDFTCVEFAAHQYCLQAVAFDGLTVENFVIRGEKDGIHLNSGKNFVIRNGRLRTADDGIAINAGEWPGYTAEMGSITDGLVENVVDEPGGKCNFARVITGAWTDWHPGMKLQRADIFAHKGYTYIIYPAPLGRNETVSMTPPEHHKGLWKSPEGLNVFCLQRDLWRKASITNVVFRNCTLSGRGIYCAWEVNEWARLIHPDLPRKDYPEIDIVLENVEKIEKRPMVYGNADAKIEFRNCHAAAGELANLWATGGTACPVRTITVDGKTMVYDQGSAQVRQVNAVD